jgi:hypothetical protein
MLELGKEAPNFEIFKATDRKEYCPNFLAKTSSRRDFFVKPGDPLDVA